jgi:hypothetical protein
VTLSTRAPSSRPVTFPEQSLIAGSVLPIQRAEELLATLPGVISARIMSSGNGQVDEIHVLTTAEVSPKQTVRNVESALIAHLGMRVSHKKISVAQSQDQAVARQPQAADVTPIRSAPSEQPSRAHTPAPQQPYQATPPGSHAAIPPSGPIHTTPSGGMTAIGYDPMANAKRKLYFEDVEVRRSRTKGVACRVTLRKGEQSFVGEAEGLENERLRIELAARATLSAISQAEGDARVLGLEGCKSIDAFDRQFVFVGVTTRVGRESALLTGSAEVKESPETASVLAILDATNRWIDYTK